MSDLSDVGRALSLIERDLSSVEARATEHEQADTRRFLQAQQGIADLHNEVGFIKDHVNLIHDQMIEGFRKLGALIEKKDPNEVTPPRRGRNGR